MYDKKVELFHFKILKLISFQKVVKKNIYHFYINFIIIFLFLLSY